MKKYIPKKGDVFKWCDEEYICIESGDNHYVRNFIWDYSNEPQLFVRELIHSEYETIFEEL